MRPLVVVCLLAAAAVLGGRASLNGLPSVLGGSDPGGGSRSGRIVRAVDGDTLLVRVAGRAERVRLIGIDTPESVRPGTPVECGAKAAAGAMRRLALQGRRVRLVFDATQDRRDRYDRLLAYVETRGGTDLGRHQVRAGWADVYVYEGRPFARVASYRAAARRARREQRGVDGACGGDFHRPAGQ